MAFCQYLPKKMEHSVLHPYEILNKNFTIPLNGFGTFFTTIVIYVPPFYLDGTLL